VVVLQSSSAVSSRVQQTVEMKGVGWGRRRRAEGAGAWSLVSEIVATTPLVESGEMVAASSAGGGHDARAVRGGGRSRAGQNIKGGIGKKGG
jgi:hypothetical protein